jgi:hypothetical protein
MLPLMRPLPEDPADIANADDNGQHDERFHGNERTLMDDACQSPAGTGAFKTGRAGSAGPRGSILRQSDPSTDFLQRL